MKILILGGLGYLGMHLACKFRIEGHEVHIFDKQQPNPLLKDTVRYDDWDNVTQGIVGRGLLSKLYADLDIDVLIHLAEESSIDVHESLTATITGCSDGMQDVLGLFSVNKHIKHLIYGSSGAVDGEVNPTTTPNPISKYGYRKLINEDVLRMGVHSINQPDKHASIVRYGNPLGCLFGMHYELFSSGSLGSALVDLSRSRSIALTEVYENGAPTGQYPMRQYLSMERFLDAHIKLIHHIPRSSCTTYHLGGVLLSNKQLLDEYCQWHGLKDIRINTVPLLKHHIKCNDFKSTLMNETLKVRTDTVQTLVRNIK